MGVEELIRIVDMRHPRGMLALLLEEEAYPVLAVADGLDAIRRLREGRPCLVILRPDGWSIRETLPDVRSHGRVRRPGDVLHTAGRRQPERQGRHLRRGDCHGGIVFEPDAMLRPDWIAQMRREATARLRPQRTVRRRAV
jgi:CheY-like chemotaxis protein